MSVLQFFRCISVLSYPSSPTAQNDTNIIVAILIKVVIRSEIPTLYYLGQGSSLFHVAFFLLSEFHLLTSNSSSDFTILLASICLSANVLKTLAW